MSPADAQERVSRTGVVPVVTLPDPAQAVPLCRALLDGGLDVVEITFRAQGAGEAIRSIRAALPDMVVGAGTVTAPQQVTEALAAGAQFAVAPGFNPRVVRAAADAGLPFWPGVCTPTDVEAALDLGAQMLKFFPAGPSGGAGMVRALLAPYRHLGVRFVPTGGIDAASAPDYWALDGVAAVGGTWLTPPEAIADGAWTRITALVREAVDACASARGGA